MKKKLVYSELKEIIYECSEYEIKKTVMEQIHETGYRDHTFEFEYDEDGDISGAKITLRYKTPKSEEEPKDIPRCCGEYMEAFSTYNGKDGKVVRIYQCSKCGSKKEVEK